MSLPPDAAGAPSPAARRLAGTLLLCFALGVVVRLPALLVPSLWIDEANTITVARGDVRGLLSRMEAMHEQHPPLYYLLLCLWMGVAGEGEAALRWLSILIGAVPVACLVARELSPGRELRAGILAALAPGLVNPSLDLRMYGLFVLTGGLVMWLWLQEPGRRGRSAGLTLATLALLSTHLVGLFLGAALGVAGLLWPAPSARQRIARVAPLVAALLLYLPWLRIVARQWGTLTGYFGWNVAGSLPLQVLRLGPYAVLGDLPPAYAPGRATQLLVTALLGLGAVRVLRDPATRRRAALIGGALALSVAGPVMVSLVTSPMFHRRYYSFLGVPAAVLLAAATWPVTSGRGARLAGRLALVGLAGLLGTVDAVRALTPRSFGMGALLADVELIRRPGEVLYHMAPDSTPQESFLVARQYRPDLPGCLIGWNGYVHPPESTAYIGDACIHPDVAAAASGKGRLLIALSGLTLAPAGAAGRGVAPAPGAPAALREAPASDLARHAAALSGALPPGWRLRRVRAYNLVELVEASP